MTRFAKIAGVALAAGMLVATGAQAQSSYVQDQRKDQLQDRVQDTNQRINQERREGNISPGEARDLKHENREIAQDAQHQAHDGGGLSKGEQRDINQQENALNRQITRQSN